MNRVVLFSITACLSLNLFSFNVKADECRLTKLEGKYTFIKLDGKLNPDDHRGNVNPIVVEPRADGSYDLNIYETVISSMLGKRVGTYGKATVQPKCTLFIQRTGENKIYYVLAVSDKGDLILGSKGLNLSGETYDNPETVAKRVE